jgi:hypothetical protein
MSKSTFIPMPLETGHTLYLNKDAITGFVNTKVDDKSCLEVYACYAYMAGNSFPRTFKVCEEHKAYNILKNNMVVKEKSSHQITLNDKLNGKH